MINSPTTRLDAVVENAARHLAASYSRRSWLGRVNRGVIVFGAAAAGLNVATLFPGGRAEAAHCEGYHAGAACWFSGSCESAGYLSGGCWYACCSASCGSSLPYAKICDCCDACGPSNGYCPSTRCFVCKQIICQISACP